MPIWCEWINALKCLLDAYGLMPNKCLLYAHGLMPNKCLFDANE